MGGQARGEWSWVSFLLFPRPCACCGGVAGWNITPEIVNGFGTLLGPEKTSAGWWVVFSGGRSRPGPSNASRGCPLLGWVGVVVVVVGFGVWWCVECCIVDASIYFFVSGFVVCACLLCVKCCRAQGGCLGIRSR